MNPVSQPGSDSVVDHGQGYGESEGKRNVIKQATFTGSSLSDSQDGKLPNNKEGQKSCPYERMGGGGIMKSGPALL